MSEPATGAIPEAGIEPQPSLAQGAALITIFTALSRITGFLRVVAVAGALGTTFLANTYNSANTAPNLVFELAAAGILTSVFVPTFVDYVVTRRREEGWIAADALTSIALLGLTAMALLVALAAPWIMRGLLVGVEPSLREDSVALGSDFLRLFAPQIVFYGAGMIMTGALHAHRRFALPAIAPIFNNVVVIGVYVGYSALRAGEPPSVEGITHAQTWLLGAGTTFGVVAMTVCLIPSLRGLGWHFRFRWQPSHPAVRKGARLGIWALGYAGGYQAGLIVVLILANRIEGGVAAYQWAYTFFYLPHALFGVPLFNVLFTAMAEHVSKGEIGELGSRLREGSKMLAFILVPVAVGLLVLASPLTEITLRYGVMTREGADLVARVLSAFAIGLPTFSAFLVLTRAFYALSDAKTPALVNATVMLVASTVGAVIFFSVERRWAVAGLALGHSIGFALGAIALGRLLRRRIGSILDRAALVVVARSVVVAAVSGAAMAGVTSLVPGDGRASALLSVVVAGVAGTVVYVGAMAAMGSAELSRLVALVRRSGDTVR